MQKTDKVRNSSIDIFRLPCAILVICIHTFPFADINPVLETIISEHIGRIAVPFFFATIGFYFVKRLLEGKEVKSTFLRLLRIYLLWSAITIIVEIIARVVSGNFNLLNFTLEYLLNFFVIGTKYQLWFFPALFLALGFLTLCNKLKILKYMVYLPFVFYVLGLLGGIYYKLGNEIPVITNIVNFAHFYKGIHRIFGIGLPFVTLGYFLNKFYEKHKKNNLLYILILALITILFFVESYLAVKFSLCVNVKTSIFLYPLIFLIMVLLIDNPSKNEKTIKWSATSRDISNFMYYSHPFFIDILRVVDLFIITIPNFKIASFAITLILTFTIGFVIHKENKKYYNFFIK